MAVKDDFEVIHVSTFYAGSSKQFGPFIPVEAHQLSEYIPFVLSEKMLRVVTIITTHVITYPRSRPRYYEEYKDIPFKNNEDYERSKEQGYHVSIRYLLNGPNYVAAPSIPDALRYIEELLK